MEDEKTAIIQITNNIYEFLDSNSTATENGEDKDLTVSPSMHLGKMYLGIEDLCSIFGYGYSYDKSTYTVSIEYQQVPSLPKKYDLRNINRVSKIRNQGSKSTFGGLRVFSFASGTIPFFG